MQLSSSNAATAAFLVGALALGDVVAGKPATAAEPWTGFYVGLNAGYGWANNHSTLQPVLFGVPVSLASQGLEEIPDSYRINSRGIIGGAQVGYNFQINRIVLGAEADLNYSGIKGDATVTGTATSGGPPVTRDFISSRSQNLKWLATLRGRVGFTPTDLWLLYVTGGVAWGSVEDSMRLSFLGIGGTTFAGSSAATLNGWTLGAGVEHRINASFTAKFEYLYFDLGRTLLPGIDVVFPNQPFQTQSQFNHTGQVIRLGLNYKLGMSR